jgi:hypothetical protein
MLASIKIARSCRCAGRSKAPPPGLDRTIGPLPSRSGNRHSCSADKMELIGGGAADMVTLFQFLEELEQNKLTVVIPGEEVERLAERFGPGVRSIGFWNKTGDGSVDPYGQHYGSR